MAKKKAERKPANIKEALGLSSFLRSERTDFLLGLIIILFAIYLFVAMSSFLTTGAADQSILESMRPGEWFNTERIFQNYCSSVGAMLSYFFMTENFGFAAFMIPSFLVEMVLRNGNSYVLAVGIPRLGGGSIYGRTDIQSWRPTRSLVCRVCRERDRSSWTCSHTLLHSHSAPDLHQHSDHHMLPPRAQSACQGHSQRWTCRIISRVEHSGEDRQRRGNRPGRCRL